MIPYDFHKAIPILIVQAIIALFIGLFLDPGVAIVGLIGIYCGTLVGWWIRTSQINDDYVLVRKNEVEDS